MLLEDTRYYMARTSATMLLGILIVLTFSTCCWTATFTLEEQLQQIRENYEILAAKVEKLEALELKVQQQERLLFTLQNKQQTNFQRSYVGVDVDNQLAFATKNALFRTCRETRTSDPSLTSGMYWIDPDGQGVGEDPIYVYCNMTTGSTSVLHDSESKTNVGHCADPGCYSRTINYSATKRQIEALTELSNECHQSIKYDCIAAPFEIAGDVAYSWWNDKDGIARYFWAGNNDSVHTCQCGIDHNCIESFMNCNCDSVLQFPLADSGVITAKKILPVTRLNFGRTILESSSGVYTLGRFECSGQVPVSGMPKSCEDLWRIGHTLSGLYSVMGTDHVESVYCDFTKLPGETSFQKLIGYVDVKSLPVYFYVRINSPSFSAVNVPIPFNEEKLNIGGAMNLTSGIFTTPRTGTYFFSFSGMASFPTANDRHILYVRLHLNGNINGIIEADNISSGQMDVFTLQSTLHLNAGDTIWVTIDTLGSQVQLYGYGKNHFTGWLLVEDIHAVSSIS